MSHEMKRAFSMSDPEGWSALQKIRAAYEPLVPPAFQAPGVQAVRGSQTTAIDPVDRAAIEKAYPNTYGLPLVTLQPTSSTSNSEQKAGALRVGVLFHGQPSPGLHNVVAGLFDSLKNLNPGSTIFGFLDGVDGLLSGNSVELTADVIDLYRNQSGLEMLGRALREHDINQSKEEVKATCQKLKLDGLVMLGGSSTATVAAHLAEFFAANSVGTAVVTAPCTIGNDLKGPFIPCTVGFDTACRVFSELVSNICTDALSAEKYYFFIRLMGRRTSHIALECQLRTQSNMVILGEEVLLSKLTLHDITKRLCDAICARSQEKGKHHGVVIFPEGLIEHIPEVHSLLEEMNTVFREGVSGADLEKRLSPWAKAVLAFLPDSVREELLHHRETDGSVRFSKIETEKLFLLLVEAEMERRTKSGAYKGKKFNGIPYFFGYQARGSLPSNFDCSLAYALGKTTARLVAASANGYMATVSGLQSDVEHWQPGGVPITALMTINRWLVGAESQDTPVPAVNPARMDIQGKAFSRLQQHKASWLMDDLYRNPGPLQFEGPGADSRPVTLELEGVDYFKKIAALDDNLAKVKELVRPGCAPEVLQAALLSMENAVDVLSILMAQNHGV